MNRLKLPLSEVMLSFDWIRTIPAALRERVIDDAFETQHVQGDLVARQGDTVSSWIGVIDGMLKISAVYRSGKAVMFTGIPTGSWVGEGSVLKRELRRYDIFAMRDSRVVHIPRATVHWLLDSSFEFNRFMLAHLNERLGQYIGMVETDRLTDPTARLARSIASLFNPVLYPQTGPLLPISQMELGELVGLSRQTTNASLKRLEQEGLVITEYGGVMVKDLAGLRSYDSDT